MSEMIPEPPDVETQDDEATEPHEDPTWEFVPNPVRLENSAYADKRL